jgi:hypothetical protein
MQISSDKKVLTSSAEFPASCIHTRSPRISKIRGERDQLDVSIISYGPSTLLTSVTHGNFSDYVELVIIQDIYDHYTVGCAPKLTQFSQPRR